MPVLQNPKWERFAVCIVQGLAQAATGKPYSQGRAYQAAGYRAKDAGKQGGSAEVAASRLLNKVQPILERVAELQSQAASRATITIERVSNRLDLASRMAEEDRAHNAMVAAETALAKVNGLQVDRIEQGKPGDFTNAQSPLDIVNAHIKAAGLEPTKPLQDQVAAVLRDAAASLAAVLERARDSQTVEH